MAAGQPHSPDLQTAVTHDAKQVQKARDICPANQTGSPPQQPRLRQPNQHARLLLAAVSLQQKVLQESH